MGDRRFLFTQNYFATVGDRVKTLEHFFIRRRTVVEFREVARVRPSARGNHERYQNTGNRGGSAHASARLQSP